MQGISLRRTRAVVVVTAISTACVLGLNATSASAVAPGVATAFGAQVTATLLGQPAVAVGPLAPAASTGPVTNSVATLALPPAALPAVTLLTTGAVTTSASFTASTGLTNATATTAAVGLPFLAALPLGIGAIAITAITATCTGTPAAVAGSTNIVGGTLAGVALPVNPAANTVLTIPLVATVTLNQQTVNADGSLTVNALHIVLLPGAAAIGTADIIVSSATCGTGLTPAVVTPPVTTVAVPVAVDAGHASSSHGYLPAELAGGVLLLGGAGALATRRRWARQQ